jgi:hypothetical protein
MTLRAELLRLGIRAFLKRGNHHLRKIGQFASELSW